VAAAALVTGVGAIVWHYRPRLPAVATVQASVDDGIIAVTNAARGHAAMTIDSLVATTACTGGAFDHGHRYTRTANLYTDPGTEDALIGRIAATLPASYQASRGNSLGSTIAPLTGKPGPGVSLTVQVVSPGWISANTATDCRSGPGDDAAPGTTGTPPAVIVGYYTALGTRLDSWHTDTLACPGGAITTTSALSATTTTAGIATRLAAAVPAGAQRVTTPSNRIIWYTTDDRRGSPRGTSTIVAASDDGTHITAQTTTDTC
jgi:hypothetical protein